MASNKIPDAMERRRLLEKSLDAKQAIATSDIAPSTTPPALAPLFSGYDLEFREGDFWRFRWEWSDQSCAQGSGCKTTNDGGVFQITLGTERVRASSCARGW